MFRVRHIALSFALAATAFTVASAQDVIHFAQPGPGLDLVQASIDGHSGAFLFDSGLGVSTLTPTMAATLGCTPWGKLAGFRATGERLDMERCNGATLMINGLNLRVNQLGVFDLGKFLGDAGKGIAGAIGLDAFDGKVITLSVASHALVVESESSAQRIAATEQEVPIRLVRDVDGAALGADLGVNTPRGMVWFQIDTGNGGPSFIDRSVASLFTLDPAKQSRQPLDLAIGKVTLHGDVIVKDLIRDGNLGRRVLQNWDITIDLLHGRGWIRPSSVKVS